MHDRWRRLPDLIRSVRCRRCGVAYVGQATLHRWDTPVLWHPGCSHRWSSAEAFAPTEPGPEPGGWAWRRIPRRWFTAPETVL